MSFDLNTVKILFDQYDIVKKNDTNEYVIKDRSNNMEYEFYNSHFAEIVKFAYTWVYATRYNSSSTSPVINNKPLSKEEYNNAFNNNAKLTYDTIMQTVIAGLQSFGRMYQEEALIEEVKKEVTYAHAADIVKGLYATPNGYAAFTYWSKCASEFEIEKGQNNFPKKK